MYFLFHSICTVKMWNANVLLYILFLYMYSLVRKPLLINLINPVGVFINVYSSNKFAASVLVNAE